MSGLNVVVDALRGAAIADFLTEHVADVAATKPPGHRYACDLAGLRRPDTTVWTAWETKRNLMLSPTSRVTLLGKKTDAFWNPTWMS